VRQPETHFGLGVAAHVAPPASGLTPGTPYDAPVNRGLTADQLGGLLDERHLATLATIRQDGSILLSPTWYVWEDGGFTLVVAAGDGKLAHMARDPRVTIVVAEEDFPYRGFEVRSVARLTDQPYSPTVRRVAARYVGEEAASRYDDGTVGVIVRIEPGDARGWDFRDDLAAKGLV
jgi:PPOX class probable F420-dependent enzyme